MCSSVEICHSLHSMLESPDILADFLKNIVCICTVCDVHFSGLWQMHESCIQLPETLQSSSITLKLPLYFPFVVNPFSPLPPQLLPGGLVWGGLSYALGKTLTRRREGGLLTLNGQEFGQVEQVQTRKEFIKAKVVVSVRVV